MKKSKKANTRQSTPRYYALESCPVNSKQEFDQRCWFIFGCFVGAARGFKPKMIKDKELLKLFIREVKKGKPPDKSGPKASYLTKIKTLKKEGRTLRQCVKLVFSDIKQQQPKRLNYDNFDAMPSLEQNRLLENIKRSLRRESQGTILIKSIPNYTKLGNLARDYFAYLCSAALSNNYLKADSKQSVTFNKILNDFDNVITSGLSQEIFKRKRIPIAQLDHKIPAVIVFEP